MGAVQGAAMVLVVAADVLIVVREGVDVDLLTDLLGLAHIAANQDDITAGPEHAERPSLSGGFVPVREADADRYTDRWQCEGLRGKLQGDPDAGSRPGRPGRVLFHSPHVCGMMRPLPRLGRGSVTGSELARGDILAHVAVRAVELLEQDDEP